MELINRISNHRMWHRHGLKIAYAVALLLCLLLIGNILWVQTTHKKTKLANYEPQKVAPIMVGKSPNYLVDDIIKANLFGNPNPAPVQKVITKTTLDLTLQGLLAATDITLARAIIRSGKSKPELYSVGEKIKGGSGVSIEEIKFNEVLLNRNGAIESLSLNKKTAKQKQALIKYSSTLPFEFPSELEEINNYQPPSTPESIVRSTPKKNSNSKRRAPRNPKNSKLSQALNKMGKI